MAVYFWTASNEFLTYDIDVVMEVPDVLAAKLAELGFNHAKDGRHWLLEGTEVLLEAPRSSLDADAVVTEIELQCRKVGTILNVMRGLAKDVAAGASLPDSGELHQIARAALHTEYAQ